MGVDRFDDIRNAALALFTEQGYRATTMADIGTAVGMRAPSLYKHVASKQDLLARIMSSTMEALLAGYRGAVATTDDPAERLRRATEVHVRYHARHRLEAFVGNREIGSLVEPSRTHVLDLRADYERGFRDLVAAGVDAGVFHVDSVRLASYAVLDLGMGVSAWYREDGELSEDAVVWQYSRFALRLVGYQGPGYQGVGYQG
ncbi:TetR/AcrR family transcriptional regulator [Prauserella rugosa]|uniref:TetR family transcriptional regulator n=1 Tax=Prauserella rugosa TaxID=43354 RepID=A0A660CG18_9PSEU|nr:TetR/AcrR family transcriptional regulator [Prauserella rugosa]KID30774.1 transcriptional regulator, TetR family [Prauserella sp. Am3]TWH19931.1 TetR family transcriptional regulator [Prauserella rugosa]